MLCSRPGRRLPILTGIEQREHGLQKKPRAEHGSDAEINLAPEPGLVAFHITQDQGHHSETTEGHHNDTDQDPRPCMADPALSVPHLFRRCAYDHGNDQAEKHEDGHVPHNEDARLRGETPRQRHGQETARDEGHQHADG